MRPVARRFFLDTEKPVRIVVDDYAPVDQAYCIGGTEIRNPANAPGYAASGMYSRVLRRYPCWPYEFKDDGAETIYAPGISWSHNGPGRYTINLSSEYRNVDWSVGKFAAMIRKPTTNDSRYPHVCPRCAGPAYVGAYDVDCAKGCK